MLTSPARRAALAALALAALTAAPASAATVTSGKLDWTTTKIYDTGAPAGTQRTWLGYVTSAFPLANGTAMPSEGATGATVNTASASSTDYTFTYPATGGTYEPATGEGTIQLDGVVTFFSPPGGAPPNGGHDFTLTVEDPKVVLAGDSGQLFASGKKAGDPVPYANAAVFNLDLSAATVTLHADGSRTIAGIVPSIATSLAVFPAPYLAGAGPDRTPNTFGSFSLRVRTAPVYGPTGPQGPKGDAGKLMRLQTSVLKRAPYPDGKRHKVSVLTTKGKRLLAKGAVRARTLSVTLADDAPAGKRLRGVVLLQIGDEPAVRVRVL